MRFLLVLVLVAAGCGGGDGSGGGTTLELGDANPGLSSELQAAFERGRRVFDRRFNQEDGHGPDFNTNSCRSCHDNPVSGGSAPLYRNFRLVAHDVGGVQTPVFEDDQLVTRLFSYRRARRETIPADAGMGLLLRIPLADVLANQDPTDDDGDGVSGRVNVDGARLGRFGYKAQEGSLEDFIRVPIFNHMGITTNPLPLAGAQVGVPGEPTTDDDGVPDPELSPEDLADLLVFTEQLAPPQPLPLDEQSTRGRDVFEEVGCAKCHIPNLRTVGDPIPAYTDLLLHDMGPELADGIRMGSATGSEFRTQPLWGVRHTAPFLHDGRADTLDDAIRMHGGEAQAVRDAYAALPQADRDAVIVFLETR